MRTPAAALCLVAWLLASPRGEARVGNVSLDELVGASQVIVDASPRRLERKGPRAGEALLSVMRVLRGSLPAGMRELTLRWSDEVHEGDITDLDHDWLLFLKSDGAGGFTAAHYGAGYLPITGRVTDQARADLDNPGRAIVPLPRGGKGGVGPLILPGRVQLTPAEAKALVTGRSVSACGAEVPAIPLARLKAHLDRVRR